MARWDYRLRLGDVFHNEDVSFEQRRDEIAKRIKASRFYDADDYTLVVVVDGLAESDSVVEFDGWWSEFYDWADANRVWVVTWNE
jgi:hypothetical protein